MREHGGVWIAALLLALAAPSVGCGGDEAGCGGARVGGACWYKGALGESCTQVCALRGGYDPATATYAGAPTAGDRSNESRCAAVAAALSTLPFGSMDNISLSDDFGCLEEPAKNRTELVSREATTEGGAHAVAARFCACRN